MLSRCHDEQDLVDLYDCSAEKTSSKHFLTSTFYLSHSFPPSDHSMQTNFITLAVKSV